VGARLFGDVGARDAYLRERLEPLATITYGREELRPFRAPVAALDSLPMAVYAFPIDPELPTLIRASDPTEMLAVFRGALPEVLGETLMLDACRVQPAKYARRRRCVLSYDLEGRLATSDEPVRHTLYGKVDADHGELIEPLLGALRERALNGAARHGFRVPRLLAVRPELNLALLEKVPGTRQIGPLIKSRVQGQADRPPLALEEAVDACAQIASSLHRWEIEVAPRRTLEDDLSALRPGLEIVARMSPDLGRRLEKSVQQIADADSTLAPLEASLNHGDYTPSQVLFDGDSAGLLDFDGLCRAEPALDVGHFSAYLRLACAKAEQAVRTGRSDLGDELSDRFVRTYVRATGTAGAEAQRLGGRIGIYEALSLVGIGVRSWQQLKPVRLSTALWVLEEVCLPRLAR
jgi:phosphotransferase family enzyme